VKDKTILWVISFLLLAGFVSAVFTVAMNYQWGTFALYAGAAGRLLGLAILIRTGQFIKTRSFKLSLLFVALVLIGSLFKIMHWPGSAVFLLTGFAGIFIIYAVHFSKKNKKGLTDFLKLMWVILILTTSTLIIFHWPGQEPVKLIESFIFCLLFWSYTFAQQKKEDDGFQWLNEDK
jgi:hypothetical protein